MTMANDPLSAIPDYVMVIGMLMVITIIGLLILWNKMKQNPNPLGQFDFKRRF